MPKLEVKHLKTDKAKTKIAELKAEIQTLRDEITDLRVQEILDNLLDTIKAEDKLLTLADERENKKK